MYVRRAYKARALPRRAGVRISEKFPVASFGSGRVLARQLLLSERPRATRRAMGRRRGGESRVRRLFILAGRVYTRPRRPLRSPAPRAACPVDPPSKWRVIDQ